MFANIRNISVFARDSPGQILGPKENGISETAYIHDGYTSNNSR